MLQVGDLRTAEGGDREGAEGRHDVALDGEPVLGCCRRLAAHRHVLAQVALGEGRDGNGLGLLCLWDGLITRADAGDDEGRAPAGFLGTDHPVAAHGDALRALGASGLHHVDLGAGGVDPDAEAGERPIPDHRVLAGSERRHGVLRDRALHGKCRGHCRGKCRGHRHVHVEPLSLLAVPSAAPSVPMSAPILPPTRAAERRSVSRARWA